MANIGGQLDIYYDENGQIDVPRVALPTALKTLYYTFVSGVLLVILVMGIFPLKAMKFYEELGLKDRALYMADLYVSRQSKKETSAFSKYADGLYYKMMLAEELYLEGGKKTKKYLNDIYDSAYKYSIIQNIDERNSQIDYNNLLYIAPIAHANVFSFKDRICNLNYFASIRLGKENEFLIGNKIFGLDNVLSTMDELDATTLKADFDSNGGDCKIALYYCIFFGQLTEYIRYNIDNMSDTKKSLTLLIQDNYRLIDKLEEKLILFKDFAFSYYDLFDELEPVFNIQIRQTQLYLVRCIGRLYDNLYTAADFLQYKSERWDALRQADIEGHSGTVTDYYFGKLLPKYVADYTVA